MDKFKWIKEQAKKDRLANTLESPDGSLFDIAVDDKGVLKTVKRKKSSTTL